MLIFLPCVCTMMVNWKVLAFKSTFTLPPIISSVSQPTKEKLLEVLNNIIEDNKNDLLPFRSETERLVSLRKSIITGMPLTKIIDGVDDVDIWDDILSLLSSDANWDNAPSLILEGYFFRRIVECLRYQETNFDPFILRKFNILEKCMPYIEQLTSRIPDLFDLPLQVSLEFLIQISLWGDDVKEELSAVMSSSIGTKKRFSIPEISSSRNANIVDNHINKVVNLLSKLASNKNTDGNSTTSSPSVRNIDIVLGGVGSELVGDLFLGHILLRLDCCDRVRFHCRSYPFGEDATNRDFFAAIQHLANPRTSDVWAVRAFGDAVRDHYMVEEFQLLVDSYWCQPTAMWDMPESVRGKFADSSLVFVKGDANYRRLLGDRQWPLDTPANEVLAYWDPVPVCALRTCKAELGCGISKAEQQRAGEEDKNWLVSGRWGVVQIGGLPIR